MSARLLVWLGVGALAAAFGAFFLVASSSSAEDEARTRRAPPRVHVAGLPQRPRREPAPEPDEPLPPDVTTEDVTLQLDLRETQGRPVVFGETNLPASTELLVTIVDGPTAGKVFERTVKCEVREGRYEAGPFPTGGEELAGEYLVTVEMPCAALQPRSVQAVIGKHGENLKGSLTQPAGTYGEAIVVHKERSVVLGGEAGLRKQRFQRLQLASHARCLANRLEDLGKTLEAADRKHLGSDAWLAFLRAFQTKLRAVKKDCAEFPRPEVREPLRAAAADLSLWVLERARYGHEAPEDDSAQLYAFSEGFFDAIREVRKALKELQVD